MTLEQKVEEQDTKKIEPKTRSKKQTASMTITKNKVEVRTGKTNLVRLLKF